MRKGLVFFLGLLTGVILTIGILYVIGVGSGTKEDLSISSEPGEVMRLKSFEVLQVLQDGSALAMSSEDAKSQYTYYGDPIVLFLPVENSPYYDDQIIEVPAKKVVRPVGTYRYKNGFGTISTVPVIKFFDK